jgi:hypothetical protein
VQQSIGRCRSFGPLPFGALARVAKVNDVTHPALDESLRGLKIVVRGFGAKCAHSVARRRAASSSIARPASTKPDERPIELNYVANTQVLRQYLRIFSSMARGLFSIKFRSLQHCECENCGPEWSCWLFHGQNLAPRPNEQGFFALAGEAPTDGRARHKRFTCHACSTTLFARRLRSAGARGIAPPADFLAWLVRRYFLRKRSS